MRARGEAPHARCVREVRTLVRLLDHLGVVADKGGKEVGEKEVEGELCGRCGVAVGASGEGDGVVEVLEPAGEARRADGALRVGGEGFVLAVVLGAVAGVIFFW